MATWRVNNSTLLGGEVCSQWQPNHEYTLGARCVCRTSYGTTARRAYVYECTTAGTSHATTEPTWPTSGTVNDNTVVWTLRNPNDGSWDNASCILHYVLNHASVAAGDLVYVDDGHNESVLIGATSAYVIKGSTTKNNPISILCVDKTDDSLSVGAVIEDLQTLTNIAYALQFNGYGYSHGIQYKSGAHITFGYSSNHTIWTIKTAPGNKIFSIAASRYLGTSTSQSYNHELHLFGDIEFLDSTSYMNLVNCIKWYSGSVIATSGVASLITLSNVNISSGIEICNVDLSAVGNNILITTGGCLQIDAIFSRCKLPGTFTPISGTLSQYDKLCRIRLHHCSSANTTYDFYEEAYSGVIQDETTIVRTGGASNGTTPISCKMVSSDNTREFGGAALSSIPITTWNTAASSKTFTIEVVHDSATALQDDEIWMELEYPADSSSGLGAVASSQCAQLGTPADIPDSSETWTTTGMTNPNTRKLSVTVTPGKAGPVTAKVYLAKASTTVYVDPLITIS